MTAFDIFGSLIVLVIVISVWTLICNQRTYNQRLRIIDWVYDGSGNWRERSRAYNEVSYDQHLFTLVMFCDPKKLYNFKETD
jgi:hypothetical protein